MEVERQRYEVVGQIDEKTGKIDPSSLAERKVGGVEKFEFGVPGDAMSMAIGGGYLSHWNPDFLQKELGNRGICARFYFDMKIAVDIGDPEDHIIRRKRKLLFRNGFGYICIPANFPQDSKRLKALKEAAVKEYYEYSERHPRTPAMQETVLVDADGRVRRAMVTAIDTKVGGGMTGSEEQQQREMRKAQKVGPKELKALKMQSKFHRKLRRSIQSGQPFRNPFITHTKRKYPVQYAS